MSAHRLMAAVVLAVLLAFGQSTPAEADVTAVPASGSPQFNQTVRVIVHSGNTVFVGGDFTTVTDESGVHSRNHVAAFDATTGLVLPWNPNVTGASVLAIAVGKKAVFIGGSFSAVKGQPRRNLARVGRGPGSKLSVKFKHRTDAPVRALCFSKGRILIGGDFMKFDGQRRWRTAAVGLKTPFRRLAWAPKPQLGGVKSIVTAPHGVYLAGDFRQFDGRTRYQRLALVSAKSGGLVRSFNPATVSVVFGIVRDGANMVAAIGGPRGGEVMSVNALTGRTVWSRGTDGDAQAVEVLDGTIFVGGHFNRVCAVGTTGLNNCEADPAIRRRLFALSSAGDLHAWDPEGNSSSGVWAIDGLVDHSLAVGGAFTTMNEGAVEARRLAVFAPLS
jgi:hypothetical protein